MKRLAVIVSILLSGCATFPVWEQTSSPAKTISWSQMSYADVQRICGGPNNPMRWTTGCAVMAGGHCAIFSMYSEEQAKVMPDHCPKASMGNHWAHERKHCGGYVHKQGC